VNDGAGMRPRPQDRRGGRGAGFDSDRIPDHTMYAHLNVKTPMLEDLAVLALIRRCVSASPSPGPRVAIVRVERCGSELCRSAAIVQRGVATARGQVLDTAGVELSFLSACLPFWSSATFRTANTRCQRRAVDISYR
jgi:hypothetical protein